MHKPITEAVKPRTTLQCIQEALEAACLDDSEQTAMAFDMAMSRLGFDLRSPDKPISTMRYMQVALSAYGHDVSDDDVKKLIDWITLRRDGDYRIAQIAKRDAFRKYWETGYHPE